MRLLFLLLLTFPIVINAQTRLHANLFGGFANYYGDLQDKSLTLDQSNGALGVGLKYDVTDHLAVRTGFLYGKIAGDDKRNKASLQFRNLNFQTKIFEWNVLAEYNFFDLNDRKFSPYVFGGLALFHFNPFTYDSLGNKFYLRPLSTEGEGLSQYPDRHPYKLTQFALPLGFGLKFRVTDNVVLSYELGFRKTFTDYLYDVSKTYVDESTLLNAKGPKAVELAYRAGELKNGDPNYPADGTKRGGQNFKDWYYFSGVTISIGLNTGSKSFFNHKGKSSVNCPVRVQ